MAKKRKQVARASRPTARSRLPVAIAAVLIVGAGIPGVVLMGQAAARPESTPKTVLPSVPVVTAPTADTGVTIPDDRPSVPGGAPTAPEIPVPTIPVPELPSVGPQVPVPGVPSIGA